MADSLVTLQAEITQCRKCPRLVAWREEAARTKVARFQKDSYWGKPLPGFGDPNATLLLVGLAPAAHGGNRTGRIFTGDKSGDFLYAALHRAGFANQPTSVSLGDGLSLSGAYVLAATRCAPPENKPTPNERDNCLPFFAREVALLPSLKVILALGAYAWDCTRKVLSSLGAQAGASPSFGHGAEAKIGAYTLLGSFHPSQRNTFTGLLTPAMMDAVFARAKELTAAK